MVYHANCFMRETGIIIRIGLLMTVLFSQTFLSPAFASNEPEAMEKGTIATLKDTIVWGENHFFMPPGGPDGLPIGLPLEILDKYVQLITCNINALFNDLSPAEQEKTFAAVQKQHLGRFLIMLNSQAESAFDEVTTALWVQICVVPNISSS